MTELQNISNLTFSQEKFVFFFCSVRDEGVHITLTYLENVHNERLITHLTCSQGKLFVFSAAFLEKYVHITLYSVFTKRP